MNILAEQIAGYGVVGALLVVALYALQKRDAELAAERAARIQDAKDTTATLMAVQKETLTAVERLSDICQILQEERRRMDR